MARKLLAHLAFTAWLLTAHLVAAFRMSDPAILTYAGKGGHPLNATADSIAGLAEVPNRTADSMVGLAEVGATAADSQIITAGIIAFGSWAVGYMTSDSFDRAFRDAPLSQGASPIADYVTPYASTIPQGRNAHGCRNTVGKMLKFEGNGTISGAYVHMLPSWSCHCSVNGKGQYVDDARIPIDNMRLSWWWDLSTLVLLRQPANRGTTDEPLMAVGFSVYIFLSGVVQRVWELELRGDCSSTVSLII